MIVMRELNGMRIPRSLRAGKRMRGGAKFLLISEQGTCFTGTLDVSVKSGRGRTVIFRDALGEAMRGPSPRSEGSRAMGR